jgi:hypothetical protein
MRLLSSKPLRMIQGGVVLIVVSMLAAFGGTANATVIGVTGELIHQPSQRDFPSTFPFSETITGTFSFIDPLLSDYDGPSDNYGGANVSQFDGIASFLLSLPTYGSITGTGGQVTTQNLPTERFQVGAGAGLSGSVSGANVATTGAAAVLQSVFLIVESTNDLLSSQNATDAAQALMDDLASWDTRTDRQIRLSFRRADAPNATIEVDYRLTSVVPEPSTLALLAIGLVGMAGGRKQIKSTR